MESWQQRKAPENEKKPLAALAIYRDIAPNAGSVEMGGNFFTGTMEWVLDLAGFHYSCFDCERGDAKRSARARINVIGQNRGKYTRERGGVYSYVPACDCEREPLSAVLVRGKSLL